VVVKLRNQRVNWNLPNDEFFSMNDLSYFAHQILLMPFAFKVELKNRFSSESHPPQTRSRPFFPLAFYGMISLQIAFLV